MKNMTSFSKYFFLLEKYIQYNVPEDKEKLMYDFYVLNYVDVLLSRSSGESTSSNLKYVSLRDDVDFEDSLNNAIEKLYTYLGSHLLDALLYAMSAEIRHMHQSEKVVLQLKGLEQKLFIAYQRAYQVLSKSDNKTIDLKGLEKIWDVKLVNLEPEERMAFQSKSYKRSYKAVKTALAKTKAAPSDFVELCSKLFGMDSYWATNYGGRPWKNIADGWLKLKDAYSAYQRTVSPRTKSTLAIYIDHAYDLQHNTDTVFNKLKTYYKSGGFEWIKKALDKKANVTKYEELFDNSTGTARYLARLFFKRYLPQSDWHKFQNQTPATVTGTPSTGSDTSGIPDVSIVFPDLMTDEIISNLVDALNDDQIILGKGGSFKVPTRLKSFESWAIIIGPATKTYTTQFFKSALRDDAIGLYVGKSTKTVYVVNRDTDIARLNVGLVVATEKLQKSTLSKPILPRVRILFPPEMSKDKIKKLFQALSDDQVVLGKGGSFKTPSNARFWGWGVHCKGTTDFQSALRPTAIAQYSTGKLPVLVYIVPRAAEGAALNPELVKESDRLRALYTKKSTDTGLIKLPAWVHTLKFQEKSMYEHILDVMPPDYMILGKGGSFTIPKQVNTFQYLSYLSLVDAKGIIKYQPDNFSDILKNVCFEVPGTHEPDDPQNDTNTILPALPIHVIGEPDDPQNDTNTIFFTKKDSPIALANPELIEATEKYQKIHQSLKDIADLESQVNLDPKKITTQKIVLPNWIHKSYPLSGKGQSDTYLTHLLKSIPDDVIILGKGGSFKKKDKFFGFFGYCFNEASCLHVNETNFKQIYLISGGDENAIYLAKEDTEIANLNPELVEETKILKKTIGLASPTTKGSSSLSPPTIAMQFPDDQLSPDDQSSLDLQQIQFPHWVKKKPHSVLIKFIQSLPDNIVVLGKGGSFSLGSNKHVNGWPIGTMYFENPEAIDYGKSKALAGKESAILYLTKKTSLIGKLNSELIKATEALKTKYSSSSQTTETELTGPSSSNLPVLPDWAYESFVIPNGEEKTRLEYILSVMPDEFIILGKGGSFKLIPKHIRFLGTIVARANSPTAIKNKIFNSVDFLKGNDPDFMYFTKKHTPIVQFNPELIRATEKLKEQFKSNTLQQPQKKPSLIQPPAEDIIYPEYSRSLERYFAENNENYINFIRAIPDNLVILGRGGKKKLFTVPDLEDTGGKFAAICIGANTIINCLKKGPETLNKLLLNDNLYAIKKQPKPTSSGQFESLNYFVPDDSPVAKANPRLVNGTRKLKEKYGLPLNPPTGESETSTENEPEDPNSFVTHFKQWKQGETNKSMAIIPKFPSWMDLETKTELAKVLHNNQIILGMGGTFDHPELPCTFKGWVIDRRENITAILYSEKPVKYKVEKFLPSLLYVGEINDPIVKPQHIYQTNNFKVLY